MEKINAWIFIVIGILYLLGLLGLDLATVDMWLIMLGFIVIGILKLVDSK